MAVTAVVVSAGMAEIAADRVPEADRTEAEAAVTIAMAETIATEAAEAIDMAETAAVDQADTMDLSIDDRPAEWVAEAVTVGDLRRRHPADMVRN